ncbi:ATP-binding protein [Streptomyces sp. NPDC059786]|uniref:ATP-binding protein n=1 Tax=Streptomyces sp. NPDC059786 TaxID=3346946 RepID=UPI00366594CB
MTTTAVRTLRAVPHRREDVLNESFKVAPSCGTAAPRAEDARRIGIVRRIAAARLEHCGLEALTDEVTLIVSELMTNALLHSGTTEINLRIAVRNGDLLIAVTDGMPGSASPQRVDTEAESGRGLSLIETLVVEQGGTWGTSDSGAGTWCVLPTVGRVP